MDLKFDSLGLKSNPFRLTPPLDPEEIKWAGMEKVKNQLENRIRIAIATEPSKIIINWGSYGSGKTHAALYFSKTQALNRITNEAKVSAAKSIKIPLPRTSNDIVQEFLRAFLGQYTLEDIYRDFQELREKLNDNDKIKLLIETFSGDALIADLVKRIVFEGQNLDDLKNYLYGESTKTLLKSLKLPYGLENDEQVANLLSAFIGCLTYNKQMYSSFFIWIDEFEDIDTVKKSLADRFTAFLRQFIDKTSNNLTLFINFTQKTFMNIEDLSLYLGEALFSRARIMIDFGNPSETEAFKFVNELCGFYLLESRSCPFENDDVILYVIKNIGNITIRKISETFSIILEMAIIYNKNVITKDFIESIKDEIIAWEEAK